MPLNATDIPKLQGAGWDRHANLSEKTFRKALNRVLTLPQCGRGPALPESSGILEKGLICVEFLPFYCSKRISVPMASIPLVKFGQVWISFGKFGSPSSPKCNF